LLGLLFQSENGGDMFLENVGWRCIPSQPPLWEHQILQNIAVYCVL
jgi:hypothetical protein